MNTAKFQRFNNPANRIKIGSSLTMTVRALAMGLALMLAQGNLVAGKVDKPKDKNLCEICKSAKAVQKCKHCDKKICTSCRATASGGKPVCKSCAGES